MIPNEPQSLIHEVPSPSLGADYVQRELVERRRLPRVSLPAEQFRLRSNGKIFAVADLSISGMALRLLDSNDRVLFPVGTAIDGWLNVDHCKHRVKAWVRNLRGDHVGCEFGDLGVELRSELSRWLDPAELGQALRPMPTPVGFGDALEWVWFHGRSGTELLARSCNGAGIDRLVLVLWGECYVEWCQENGISSGKVRLADDRDSVQGVFRLAPEWFHVDAELDPAKLDLANTVVSHSRLPEDWKNWVATARR